MKNKRLVQIVLVLALASILVFGKAFWEGTEGTSAPETAFENFTEAAEAPGEMAGPPAQIETETYALQAQESSAETKLSEAEEEFLCSMTINCETILNNMDKLHPGKEELIPENGILFAAEGIMFKPGETVFGLLRRTTRENKIHMEFVNSPGGSAYIEGIGNIYEFDCGELSGWLFNVNGAYPGVSASQYELENGDAVEWIYSCDLGRDVGGGESGI